jgi:large conductance mechanosensitive channel
MGMLADFKAFALKGNVLDLAVGVIVGGAFGTITKSLVDDVLMPPLGLLLGRVDFKELYVPLSLEKYAELKKDLKDVAPTLAQAVEKGVPTLRYGAFINTCINFVFVAIAVFVLVKVISKLQKQKPPPPAAPPEPTPTEKLLTEIRDALKARPPK